MIGLQDILTSLQDGVTALSDLQQTQAKSVPEFTTGLLAADTLVLPGFVRVLGVSVVDGSAIGFLHDAAALADAVATNQVYVISTTKAYYPVNLVFQNGLVFKVGTANEAVLYYSRV
jgi:hypothetical protein